MKFLPILLLLPLVGCAAKKPKPSEQLTTLAISPSCVTRDILLHCKDPNNYQTCRAEIPFKSGCEKIVVTSTK